jgi:hypothetical protein
MPAQYVTSIVEGQDFYVSDIDPTGVVSAPRGSVCLRTDNGNSLIYLNTTVGSGAGVGTTWVALLSTDLTDLSQLILAANANPALQIGPAALLDLLKFITTTGAAQVAINTNQAPFLLTGSNGISLTGVAATFTAVNQDALDIAKNAASQSTAVTKLAGVVTMTYGVPANATGGNVDNNIVLSTTRNMRITDAFLVSSGTNTGSVQVRTTTGAISDAMVPAAVASGLTRATVLVGSTLLAGATVVVRTATNTVAGTTLRLIFETA